MVSSGISAKKIISSVVETTTNTIGVVNSYIRIESSKFTGINSMSDIVNKFTVLVRSFMDVLGSNRMAIVCSCLIAVVVIYFLFFNRRSEENNKPKLKEVGVDNVSPEYIASCIEDLVLAQSIIIDFCNSVVEQADTAQVDLNQKVINFKAGLKGLGRDCVEFKKYFDPSLFDGLDYLTILENIHDNIERLMVDLGALINMLTVETWKKDIFSGQVQSIYTHIKSKLLLKISIVKGSEREKIVGSKGIVRSIGG